MRNPNRNDSPGDYEKPIKKAHLYIIYIIVENKNYFFVMNIYLLIATTISNINEFDVYTLAFRE